MDREYRITSGATFNCPGNETQELIWVLAGNPPPDVCMLLACSMRISYPACKYPDTACDQCEIYEQWQSTPTFLANTNRDL